MHKAAKGQDLGQSGTAGFSCGQGIPPDMDAMSPIAPAGAAAIATGGPAMGTVRRLTTARIESKRDRTGRSFTFSMSHMLRCKKRADCSRCRENAVANGHGTQGGRFSTGHDRGCDERFQLIAAAPAVSPTVLAHGPASIAVTMRSPTPRRLRYRRRYQYEVQTFRNSCRVLRPVDGSRWRRSLCPRAGHRSLEDGRAALRQRYNPRLGRRSA